MNIRLLLTLACTVLLAAGCAVPLPQSPPPGMAAAVGAPRVTVGDTWTYRLRDLYTGLERGTERRRVTEAGSARTVVNVQRREDRAEEQEYYDREGNWLRAPATNLPVFDYTPAYQAWAFPLSAGKTWHSRTTAIEPATGRRFPVWIDGTVMGWEKVSVPAGSFDALKVRRAVFIEYFEYTVRGRSEIIEYEWYSPAVGHAVKRETRSRYLSHLHTDSEGGPQFIEDDWLISELVGYSAPQAVAASSH